MALSEIISVRPAQVHPEQIRGHNIETPNNVLVGGPTVEVTGWVLGRRCPVAEVEVLLAGKVVARTRPNLARHDLLQYLPELKSAEGLGYRLSVDVAAVKSFTLHVRARLRDGDTVDLGVVEGRRRWRELAEGTPLLSLIVAGAPASLLAEPVAAALAQSYPHIEVLVVDDGSGDPPIFSHPAVRRVRAVAGEELRNLGLRASAGSFVAFLGAGDRMHPTALEAGLACLRARPEAACAVGLSRRTEADGAACPAAPLQPGPAEAALLRGDVLSLAAALFRRSSFEALRGLDQRLGAVSWLDLLLRAASTADLAYHPSVVVTCARPVPRRPADIDREYRAARHLLAGRGRRPELRQPCREGLRLLRASYERQMAEAARAALRSGRLLDALPGLAFLLRQPLPSARALAASGSSALQAHPTGALAAEQSAIHWEQVSSRRVNAPQPLSPEEVC